MTHATQISANLAHSQSSLLIINRWRKMVIRHERAIAYFYGDSQGKVTTGYGHLLKSSKDALALRNILYVNGKKATDAQIEKAFNAVSQAAKQRFAHCKSISKNESMFSNCMFTAENYEKLNNGLSMETDKNRNGDMEALLEQDLFTKLRELQAELRRLSSRPFYKPRFSALHHYPHPVQLALLDMTYNMGAGGLTGESLGGAKGKNGFPIMLHAIRKSNFATAAKQSNRPQVGPERNEEIYNLFMEAHNLQKAFMKELTAELF
jgi:GH24 family phage-related lysozyme (muramidase)